MVPNTADGLEPVSGFADNFNQDGEERSDFRPSLRMVWSSAITILNAFFIDRSCAAGSPVFRENT